MREEVLRLERVTYLEDGVTLLDNFNLHIFKGEIMGLISANALGRRELIRLMCRNLPLHYGRVYFREQLVNCYERNSMSVNPVAVIEKQSRLVENLTVADNIFVLRRGFRKFVINPKVLSHQLEYYTKALNIGISGDTLVSSLSFFEKCVVELLKAVITGARLVVIKDISNFISAADLVKIHQLIRYYAGQGVSFLYVCNHHEEVFTIADRAALMENGKILKVFDRSEFRDEMVAPYCKPFFQTVALQNQKYGGLAEHAGVSGAPGSEDRSALRFEHVCTDAVHDLSFSVQKGECVILLDMNNTALHDLLSIANGEKSPDSGSIWLGGRRFRKRRFLQPQTDIGIIQEKPTHSMLFPNMSYLDNLCFTSDRKHRFMWTGYRAKQSVAKEYEPICGSGDIYAPDIGSLSTRSRYNLVYYRMHLLHPKAVFCVQPFAEADMDLRLHIIGLMNQLRERQIAVVILAVNLSDSLVVADRLLILENGRLQKEIERKDFRAFGINP